jgi:hypothetical protein
LYNLKFDEGMNRQQWFTHLNRINPLSDNGGIHVKVIFILNLSFNWITVFYIYVSLIEVIMHILFIIRLQLTINLKCSIYIIINTLLFVYDWLQII